MRPYPIGNGTVSPRIPREVASLMEALQLEGSNTDALLELEDADWQRLLEFCDLAHLTLALSQANTSGFPGWVMRRLGQNAADNAQRFERVKAAYVEAAAVMGQAGAAHVVLKGFAHVPDFVKDPRLRAQSDIDVYCLPAHLEQAKSALENIGYRQAEGADIHADHLPGLSRPGDWTWRGNPYDPEMPPGIALHFCFWNARNSLIEIPEAESFWERRVVRRLGKIEFSSLHPVDQLGYLAIHILRGVLTGDWVIHHVFELATFLQSRTRDVEFWSQWHDLHSVNLRTVEAVAFGLAHIWFSCSLPEVVRVEVDRLPPGQKRWLKRFGGSPLEAMFRHNKDGRLLQLLLTRSRTSRQTVLRKMMILARTPALDAPMRVRYGRQVRYADRKKLVVYAQFLVRTVVANWAANIAFFLHGARLWFSTRAVTAQFWTFLAVFSVLTSGFPSTFSSIPS